MNLHLEILNSMNHSRNQACMDKTDVLLYPGMSLNSIISLKSKLSSALRDKAQSLVSTSVTPLIYSKNKRSPRTNPWGTLERTLAGADDSPPMKPI